jgi:hypothetical protein
MKPCAYGITQKPFLLNLYTFFFGESAFRTPLFRNQVAVVVFVSEDRSHRMQAKAFGMYVKASCRTCNMCRVQLLHADLNS